MTLAPGTTVGRYQILAPLGQGGMATVYKAFQPSLQRDVALKVLRPGYAQDAEFKERFEREAIAIAKLRHPNIVQVFDFELTDGQYALAMEFLEGGTLKERLTQLASQQRGLDAKGAVRIVWEVADALSYAHERGIIHRDVKPSNVMLAAPRERAVVTDFGIARILGATSHTQTGVGIGTPEYMAPEQGQGGAIDHRADIYSLGAMAYEMLTGRVPYLADTPLAVVLAHMKDPLPLPSKVNPTIGKNVERALLKALAKDREQRFPSAIAFAEALRDGLAEDSRGGTVPTIVVRGAAGSVVAASVMRRGAAPSISISLPAPLARRPIVFGVAGALLVGVVGGGLVASSALRSTPEATPALANAPVVGGPASAAAAAPLSTVATATLTATPSRAVVTAPGTSPAPPAASPAAFAAPPQVAASPAAPTPAPPAAFTPAPTPAPTPTPPPTPPPTPTPKPPHAIPPKGELLFQALLNGTSADVQNVSNNPGPGTTNTSPDAATIRYLTGAIEVAILKPGGGLGFQFSAPASSTYVAEWDLSVAPGSAIGMNIAVSCPVGTGDCYFIGITTSAQSLRLFKPNVYDSGPIPVPGMQQGTVFTVAATIEAQRITVFLNERQVAQRSASGGALLSFGIESQGGTTGSVRFVGARYYALP